MTNDEQKSIPNYLFLDGKPEREQLIRDIAEVKQEVATILGNLPEDEWYTPRYHGWSPAAMLAHLNMVDALSLWTIKLALLGFAPTMSQGMLNQMNDMMAKIFRKRVMQASLTSMERNQKRVADFVENLPMNRFSRKVFNPATQTYLTVEQAIQTFFLHHWHLHLATIRQVEGIQPPTRTEDG